MKFDIHIKEEEEVNVKTEKVIDSEEGNCIDIKCEESFHIEEKEEDIAIKEEVRMRIYCNIV